jgi:hypothetical protein
LEWFQRCEHKPEEQPRRVDYYLRHVGIDSLGIKLREGRVEVKQRYRRCGVVRFHERVAGQVEHWRKWSFGLAESDGDLPGVSTLAPFWIRVEKRRTLRKYRIVGNGVMAVREGEDFDQGCALELTSIRVGRAEWWSVGLEAFGEELVLEDALLLVAKHLLAVEEPPVLEVADSYGYPRWLTTHALPTESI